MSSATHRQIPTDTELRSLIRRELPSHLFESRTNRIWTGIPYIAAIIGLSCVLAFYALPIVVALLLSVLLGNLWVGFFFWGHDLYHGVMIRNRTWRMRIGYVPSVIFLASPKLLHLWHVGVHHKHTNVPLRDPDRRPALTEYIAGTTEWWIQSRFQPGSGHPLSLLYPLCAFPLHLQRMLFEPNYPGLSELNRTRAKLDSGLMLLFWGAVSYAVGWPGVVYVVLVPMLTTWTIVMCYIMTNHLLRPHADPSEHKTLLTSMSVKVSPVIDLLHRNFSHHIEHHLFPTLDSRHLSKVRRILQREVPDLYLAPAWPKAIKTVFQTPPFVDADEFVNPLTGARIAINDVERRLC